MVCVVAEPDSFYCKTCWFVDLQITGKCDCNTSNVIAKTYLVVCLPLEKKVCMIAASDEPLSVATTC
jgi:hypothetical protein